MLFSKKRSWMLAAALFAAMILTVSFAITASANDSAAVTDSPTMYFDVTGAGDKLTGTLKVKGDIGGLVGMLIEIDNRVVTLNGAPEEPESELTPLDGAHKMIAEGWGAAAEGMPVVYYSKVGDFGYIQIMISPDSAVNLDELTEILSFDFTVIEKKHPEVPVNNSIILAVDSEIANVGEPIVMTMADGSVETYVDAGVKVNYTAGIPENMEGFWEAGNAEWSLTTEGVLTVVGTAELLGNESNESIFNLEQLAEYVMDIKTLIVSGDSAVLEDEAFFGGRALTKIDLTGMSNLVYMTASSLAACSEDATILLPETINDGMNEELTNGINQRVPSMYKHYFTTNYTIDEAEDFMLDIYEQVNADIYATWEEKGWPVDALPQYTCTLQENKYFMIGDMLYIRFRADIILPEDGVIFEENGNQYILSLEQNPETGEYSKKGVLTITGSGVLNGKNGRLRNYPEIEMYFPLISKVVIDGDFTAIGKQTFKGLGDISSITMPDSITEIGDEAFYNCPGLGSLTLPANLAVLGQNVFTKSALTEDTLIFPADYEANVADYIAQQIAANTGNYIFSYYHTADSEEAAAKAMQTKVLAALREMGIEMYYDVSYVNISGSNEPYSNVRMTFAPSIPEAGITYHDAAGNLFVLDPSGTLTVTGSGWINGESNADNRIQLSTKSVFAPYTPLITKVVVSEGITGIGFHTFAEMTELAEVELPSTLVEMAQGVFYYTPKLTAIDLPASLEVIGPGLFQSSGLTSLTLPESITSIDINLGTNCRDLTSLSIPAAYKTNTIDLIAEAVADRTETLTLYYYYQGDFNAQTDLLDAMIEKLGKKSVMIAEASVASEPYAQSFKNSGITDWACAKVTFTFSYNFDVNDDGALDAADLEAMLSVLFKQDFSAYPNADIKVKGVGDGYVDAYDLALLLNALKSVNG